MLLDAFDIVELGLRPLKATFGAVEIELLKG